jgi:hypothetical protein
MPTPPLTREQMIDALVARDECGGNISATAEKMGLSRRAVRHRLDKAKEAGLDWGKGEEFQVPEPLSELRPVEELIAERKTRFSRRKNVYESKKLVPVKICIDGPIGIMHMGDPHVDDDGTDIYALERDTDLCRQTPGLFAATVGDLQNNWIGRLAALYAKQSTSAQEAWQLVEWLVRRADWLYMIAGNHDCWSGQRDPLEWIASQNELRIDNHGTRLELIFPNGRKVRVNARHDFKGTSQWNPAHGPAKAAQMGWRDHILTCGHKHVSGYNILKDPATGVISHAIRVAGYKIIDDYAAANNFPDQNISPCCVTVIDPESTTEVGLVTAFWEPEMAADYLMWLRERRKAA